MASVASLKDSHLLTTYDGRPGLSSQWLLIGRWGGGNEETGDTSDFRRGMHSQGWGGGKGKTWVCKDHVLPSHYCCEFPSSGLIGSHCYGYNVYISYIAAKLKYVINMN